MEWFSIKPYLFLFFYIIIKSSNSQQVKSELDAIHEATSSLNDFAVRLLLQSSERVGGNFNLALAPYPIWSLLSIIAEGAKEDTAKQLEEVLKIPSQTERGQFRRNYRSLKKYLKQKSDGIELDISNAIFTTKEQTLNRTYQMMVKNFYDVEIMPVDFKNLLQTQNVVNLYIAKLTNNLIKNLVTVDDLIDAEVLLTSTLYFKGQWTTPFNKTATFKDKFYDGKGTQLGEVMMMYQMGPFPFVMLSSVKAYFVELPYGKDQKMSMIVALPIEKRDLNTILRGIAAMPFKTILDALEDSRQYEEDVLVYLPRFAISSDLILNAILSEMGIKDVFNAGRANLLGMFPHFLYLSRVIQQAKIDVDEEGTEAAAVAGGVFAFKSPPPRFYANKPFAFFIVDKETNAIVFEGKVSTSNGI